MDFNKIELVGFKSFADRLEIRFDVGVTGIVGPNGCGKSNVADAIRWVLGEQSAKQLRGSSMQDVLFSGTKNRKSVSYCEVSLFFDNTNRIFSIDYNEVVITRKLYRSGESEYYINRQIARLKDIVNLLHEVGIGKEGYSIIGQGKVESILSAKPEERRAIFEEATGISKFKGSKADIERKLGRTKDNLIRYADILSELERQIGPLKRQAEEAIRYKDLSEKIKYQEVNHFVFKTQNVGAERAKVQARIDAIMEEIATKDNEFATAQARYNRIGTDIVLTDAAVQKVNEDILQNSVDNEKRLGDEKVFGEKISACRREIERLRENLRILQERKEKAEEQIRLKTLTKEEKIQALAEMDALQEQQKAELRTLITRISVYEGETAESQRKMLENFRSVSDTAALNERRSMLSSRQQEVLDKVEALKEKLRAAEIDGQSYAKQAEDLKKKNEDLDKVIAEKQTQSFILKEKVRDYNAKIITLNNQLTTLVSKQNFLKEMRTSYEGFGEAVKVLMNGAEQDVQIKKRVLGVIAKIIKSDQKYYTALETALGGSMQSVVVQDPEDTKYLISYLKQNRAGRITFLPIASVRARYESESVKRATREPGAVGLATELVTYDSRFDGIIRNLLGNTLVVDGLDNAIAISKKYQSAFKIVTLDGENFSTQGAITGGSSARSLHLLGGDKQLAGVEADVARAKESLAKGERLVEEFTERQARMAEEIETIRENIRQNQQAYVIANEKALSFAAEYKRISDEIDSYAEEIAVIESTITMIAEQTALAGENGGVVPSEMDQQRLAEELESLKRRRDELMDATTARAVDRAELVAEIAAIAADIDRLTGAISVAETESESERETLSNNERILLLLTEQAAKVALSEEEQNVIVEMKNRLKELEEKKVDLLKAQSETDEEKQNINNEILVLNARRGEEDIALAKIDSDLEHLAESIKEAYEMDYEACLLMKDENFDDYGSLAETARLKRERSHIKNVNLNAEEDYADVSVRYEEMSTQKADVEKAQADLEEALEKLTNEMLSTFNAGFKVINENFQQTFKELFGGGNAMLEVEPVEEGQDPLSAGIAIKAQPPGKEKIGRLSLLSGGERALTAIAILFAIIQMRPMPFCVLDEIEAALDEVNTKRFATYLKKFSERTQFIVITHRKPTMEMADALYGVTMEEQGVSKMVSVKLSEIKEDMLDEQGA